PLSTHPPPVYPPPAPASPTGRTTAHSPWPQGSYSPPSGCTPHHPPPPPHRPACRLLPCRTHTTHPAGADTPITAPTPPTTTHTSFVPAGNCASASCILATLRIFVCWRSFLVSVWWRAATS